MPETPSWAEEDSYELEDAHATTDRDGLLSATDLESDRADSHLLGLNPQSAYPGQSSILNRLLKFTPFADRRHRYICDRKSRTTLCTYLRSIALLVGAVLFIAAASAVLFPPYAYPPAHYTELRKRIESADATEVSGVANPQGQKIFLAASIFDKDGELANGAWGECLLKLIQILGPQNTYLSIYENDAGNVARDALEVLRQKVPCENTLRFDEHLDFSEVEHVTLPDGSDRIKRITYLSEARNRALLPLETTSTQYDKLLYLNDVVFDPIEVVQLLFLTGVDKTVDGKATDYRAACAVDFINPIKYYDTFATRDYEGYGIGLPLFPWYTTAGKAVSRGDVMAGSDSVRVRSCWGGLVAFDAQFFQPRNVDKSTAVDGESSVTLVDIPITAGSKGPSNMSAPYRFRAEPDLFWDASECCLIHADIQNADPTNSGIYMNPYVRTSYDLGTLKWLKTVRRFEKLLTPVHWILTKLVGMPWYNTRRAEQPWEEVEERVWDLDLASWVSKRRVASHSGFCGRPGLQLMKIDPSEGDKPWEFFPLPGS